MARCNNHKINPKIEKHIHHGINYLINGVSRLGPCMHTQNIQLLMLKIPTMRPEAKNRALRTIENLQAQIETVVDEG